MSVFHLSIPPTNMCYLLCATCVIKLSHMTVADIRQFFHMVQPPVTTVGEKRLSLVEGSGEVRVFTRKVLVCTKHS